MSKPTQGRIAKEVAACLPPGVLSRVARHHGHPFLNEHVTALCRTVFIPQGALYALVVTRGYDRGVFEVQRQGEQYRYTGNIYGRHSLCRMITRREMRYTAILLKKTGERPSGWPELAAVRACSQVIDGRQFRPALYELEMLAEQAVSGVAYEVPRTSKKGVTLRRQWLPDRL